MSASLTCKHDVLVHGRQKHLTRITAAKFARSLSNCPRNEMDNALRELENNGCVAREVEGTNSEVTLMETYL